MSYKSNNDEAIAYGWMVITIFIVISGFLIAVYYGVINAILVGPNGDNSVGVNHDILAGKQSEQSKRAIQFNTDFATNVPFLVAMGILIFAVARAIVVKKVP